MRNYFPTILELDCIFRIILTVKMFLTKKFIQKKSIFIEYNIKKKKQENQDEKKDFLINSQ